MASTVSMDRTGLSQQTLRDAAIRLHDYLKREHWNGHTVSGPDPGIRFNARIGRFIKSYLGFLPWSDKLVYAQGQKYWIQSNWLISDLELADAQSCKEISVACSEYLLDVQRPEGYWEYPNPEWKGRIATVEGNYAAMGLLDTFSHTQDERFLDGAKKWYHYAVDHIGFRQGHGGLGINYFGNLGTMMVPNNSASALRIFAWLADVAEDEDYLEYCGPMVSFLREVQLDSGELPYGVAWPDEPNGRDRIHFLCYQYNAFEFLNLADYYALTGDAEIGPVLERLAGFVCQGVLPSGACRYDCHRDHPEVAYYALAAGAALDRATELGIGNFSEQSDRAYQRVLSQQRPDGNMNFYSKNNYRVLADRRSYPRYLSMMLYHLLSRLKSPVSSPTELVHGKGLS